MRADIPIETRKIEQHWENVISILNKYTANTGSATVLFEGTAQHELLHNYMDLPSWSCFDFPYIIVLTLTERLLLSARLADFLRDEVTQLLYEEFGVRELISREDDMLLVLPPLPILALLSVEPLSYKIPSAASLEMHPALFTSSCTAVCDKNISHVTTTSVMWQQHQSCDNSIRHVTATLVVWQ